VASAEERAEAHLTGYAHRPLTVGQRPGQVGGIGLGPHLALDPVALRLEPALLVGPGHAEPPLDLSRGIVPATREEVRLGEHGHVPGVGGHEAEGSGLGGGLFEEGDRLGNAASRRTDVTMLTISREQFAYLSEWCAIHTLPARLSVAYESIFAYAPGERYDAIVLCGVMEHLPDYPALFQRFDMLLEPGGRVYMDFAAGRKKFDVSAFTYRYVFPGDHTPVVLPELFAAANQTALEPVALHNDRHSYYLTLQAWARNLEAAKRELVGRYGERVFRLFQIYLWAGAHLHRDGGLEAYRAVFEKGKNLPSAEIGLGRESSGSR